jgi:hypothetical protein
MPQCAWLVPMRLPLRVHPRSRRSSLHGPERVRVGGKQLPLRLQEHHRHLHVRLPRRLQEGRSHGRVRRHRRVRRKSGRLFRRRNLHQYSWWIHLRVPTRLLLRSFISKVKIFVNEHFWLRGQLNICIVKSSIH